MTLFTPGRNIGQIITSTSDSSTATEMDSLNSRTEPIASRWIAKDSEISRILAEDVVDYVPLLPNVTALDRGSIGQFSPFIFRGSSQADGKIALDDILLDEPINGFVTSKFLPLNIVEGLEFFGPGSVAPFGLTAAGGMLRAETYEFQGGRPFSKVLFRAGDFGYSDIGIMFGLPITKKTDFLIDGNRQEFDGLNNSHEGTRVLTKVSHQVNNVLIKHLAFLNKNDVTVPAPFLPNWVPGNVVSQWEEDRLDQVLSVRVGNLAQAGRRLLGRLHFTRIQQESTVDTLSFDNENLTIKTNFNYDLLLGNHWLTIGGEFRHDDLNSVQLVDHNDGFGRVFVRDVYRLPEKWEIGIQVNLEKHEEFSLAVNPSLRVAYEPSNRQSLWFGAQRSKRYPTFAERFWPTEFFRGNPSLSDEESSAIEIGYAFEKKDQFKFRTSVFANRVEDWIGNSILADTLAIAVSNLDNRTTAGLDLKFSWDFWRTGRFGFVGSYLNLTEQSPEKQLQVPEYAIYSYLEVGHHFFEKFVFFRARFVGRVLGERHGINFLTARSTPTRVDLDSEVIFDAQATAQFSDAKITASFENIFGISYELVPGFPMPERMFRFGIEWAFLD
ncbi:TonB-dependent receptor [candidate division KSB1 bacterium]|nr:TonB-dependent receptor [candidate division KSB1 bacterium]NIS23605.1 TonB-dependent receptor [candidate division KSB1 bacterium]NIU24236.1 TonB-dependent receptor [candidate division KSB1 bacterium]NIU93791.1 TonB-dependent receptor [candidate division KSB1 bacterium]NIV96476.1 TonB-dependent receptor [candidate division KSB1 bacterium]